MKTTDQPTIQTPLYSMAEGLGARFVTQASWRLPGVYSSEEAESSAAREGVALADQSANGKIMLEGAAAGAVLKATWDAPDLEINQGTAVSLSEDGPHAAHACRLRSDLYYVSTPPGTERNALEAFSRAARDVDQLVSVTNVTHGRSELWLIGPSAAELLSRLCGLDFHSSSFSNLTAKQSSLAKTAQLIVRRDLADLPVYALIGARSLGAYLWQTIMEAGEDLEIAPLGQAALQVLMTTR